MPRSRRYRRSGYWGSSRHRRSARRGMFGGQIKSVDEVKNLNRKIVQHEQQEFAAFEAQFDEELQELS